MISMFNFELHSKFCVASDSFVYVSRNLHLFDPRMAPTRLVGI